MLELLNKIASIPRLAPLMAVEACATPGETIELEGFSVIEDEGGRLLVDEDGLTLCRVHERDDLISLQRDVRQSQELNAILGILGAGKDGRSLAEGSWIGVEALTERTAAVEQALQTIRACREQTSCEADAIELAGDVLQLARTWALLRAELFDSSQRQWASKMATGRLEQREASLQAALAAFHAAREAKDQSVRLVLESDPRGSALRLVSRGLANREIFLMGLSLSWPMGTDGTGKVGRGRQRERAAQVSAPTSTGVPDAVAAVLREASCDGKALKLPGKLDRELYAKVDAILKGMGAKWNRSAGAHVFKSDAAAVVASALGTGSITTDRDWEYFATPAALVQRMLSKVDLQQGMKVLEPQGGEGAIALEAAKLVGMENVHCFELMPRNAQTLAKLGFQVTEIDFLATQPSRRYEVILMNPPFGNLADAAHIEHAAKWLKPGGTLVAVSSTSWQLRNTARAKGFREWLANMDAEVEPIAAGTFRESGTDVSTLLITLRVPAADRQTSAGLLSNSVKEAQADLFGELV